MNHLKQYIPMPLSRNERLSILREHFNPILHKNKINKKRMKSFKGKKYYFKKDNLHIFYKIHDINFKTGPQYRAVIVKELNTPEGKLYAIVNSIDNGFKNINTFFVKHTVHRYQERLNLESYEEALKKFISEFDYVLFEDGEKEGDFRARINNGLLFGDKCPNSNIALIKTFIANEVLNKKKYKFKKELDNHYEETNDNVTKHLEKIALMNIY